MFDSTNFPCNNEEYISMKQTNTTTIDITQRILGSYWNSVLAGKPSMVHFNTALPNQFHSIVADFTAQIQEPFSLYPVTIEPTPCQEPYAPFLPLIRQVLMEMGDAADEIIEKAGIYTMQRSVFKAWLAGVPPLRRDIPIIEEIRYEKKQVQRSVFALLRVLAELKPLIIAVSGVRFATPAVLDFLCYIRESESNARIMILLAFDRTMHWMDDSDGERWEHFLLKTEEKAAIFDLDPAGSVNALHDTPNHSSLPSPEELAARARSNLVFFCLDEALVNAREAQNAILSMDAQQTGQLQYNILNTMGDAHYFKGEASHALLNYQTVVERAQRSDDHKMLAKAYRKTGFAYLQLGDLDSAQRFANLHVKLAERLGDDMHRIYAYYLKFIVGVRTSTLIPREMYYALMSLLERPGQENMYAFFCQNAVSYSPFFESYQEILVLIDRAIGFYKRSGNEFGLSFAYHKKAIVYSNNALYEESFNYMKRSLRIRLQIGDPLYIIRIQNGIGYLYHLTGDYPKAYTYFRKSLQILMSVHNYDEITATLYNFALLYFICGYYGRAQLILDRILKIMLTLKLRYIPYHCIEDIYLLKALCTAKTGQTTKTLEMLNKVRNSGRDLPWRTLFMYKIAEILAGVPDPKGRTTAERFEEAGQLIKRGQDNSRDALAFYYVEYSKALQNEGRVLMAREILSEGIDFCQEAGYEHHAARMRTLKENGQAPEILCELEELKVSLETLVELAQQEFVVNRLQNKIRDIRFLNTIQTGLMQLTDRKAVAEKLLNLVYYQFPMEISSFHLVGEENGDTVLAQNLPEQFDTGSLDLILRSLASRTPKMVMEQNEIAESFPDCTLKLNNIVSIPVAQHGIPVAWIFLATQKPDQRLTSEDLEILVIAAGQISILFEKIHHEEEITRMSRQDPLSGLYNRQALQTKLHEEAIRIKRYKDRTHINFSVAFIDLDNFKYYNDTFGHKIGDLLIIEFSKLLVHNFREIDFVARFGGDEFIVIMPETSAAQAEIPLNRIYTHLRTRKYFQPEIEKNLGHTVSVPEEWAISCSIGVASWESGSSRNDDVETLLQLADKALYQAKEKGKKQLFIWTET